MEKKIPLKNYILLGVTVIITILLVIYAYTWYNTYEESKLNTPIMDEYLKIINYNELDNYLTENKEAIIYSSTLGNIKTRYFENKFKNIIQKNSLNNDILYLDLTSELQDNKLTKEIQNKYTLNNDSMASTPLIIIFKNGKISSMYNIKENNYDINKLLNYLEEEEIIND